MEVKREGGEEGGRDGESISKDMQECTLDDNSVISHIMLRCYVPGLLHCDYNMAFSQCTCVPASISSGLLR